MALDTSASQTATNALQSIPFGNIIGGPLNACIEAQAQSAQTTWRFIQEVGLRSDENGKREAVSVNFEYVQGGRKLMLIVPLLTIVPIPYIAIDEIEINFKAQISASASTSSEKSNSTGMEAGVSASARFGGFLNHGKVNMHANFSSKKDSKSTQESKYSVEYTMDVRVHAMQDSMPAGMARILEILNSSVDSVNSKGELYASDNVLYLTKDTSVVTVASYKSAEGLLSPRDIEIFDADDKSILKLPDGKNKDENKSKGVSIRLSDSGENLLCSFTKKGAFYLKANECQQLVTVI